METVNSNSCGD